MAFPPRPFWTSCWTATTLALLLVTTHISLVTSYTPTRSVISDISSGRATNLPSLNRRGPYVDGFPTTLSTSILPRDAENDGDEANPDNSALPNDDEEDGSGMEDNDDESKPDDDNEPLSNNNEDLPSDAPTTCASENAEIDRLTLDIAHCNLYQKPQDDQALQPVQDERADLLKKLDGMTTERDHEHKRFLDEFHARLGTNDALLAAQKEAFVTNNELQEVRKMLDRCKYDIDRLMDCPKRKCFFIICI